MKVHVTFDIPADSKEHAEHVIARYLERKGVVERGEEELTNNQTEQRFGYTHLEAITGQQVV